MREAGASSVRIARSRHRPRRWHRTGLIPEKRFAPFRILRTRPSRPRGLSLASPALSRASPAKSPRGTNRENDSAGAGQQPRATECRGHAPRSQRHSTARAAAGPVGKQPNEPSPRVDRGKPSLLALTTGGGGCDPLGLAATIHRGWFSFPQDLRALGRHDGENAACEDGHVEGSRPRGHSGGEGHDSVEQGNHPHRSRPEHWHAAPGRDRNHEHSSHGDRGHHREGPVICGAADRALLARLFAELTSPKPR
jgi:hypothetical protein